MFWARERYSWLNMELYEAYSLLEGCVVSDRLYVN